MEIDTNNLHHAYLLEGEISLGNKYLDSLFLRLGIDTVQNPDRHVFNSGVFTVDEARGLIERAQSKSFGERSVFIISSPHLTKEAQNALLKTLEEPQPNKHFFLLASNRDLLLPTLLSRLMIVRMDRGDYSSNRSGNFLSLSPKNRLAFAKEFADKEGDLGSFLDSLLADLKKENRSKTDIDKVFSVRRFADDTSVQPRLILEHLALVLK
ncbi:MAG: DNA polymerase III delta prime subunit [Parcubacteria bacterium C7867-005]|nr:MAG: DNA polymerase III delta prime subunit [Parcubacteria bacterium C7867-005]